MNKLSENIIAWQFAGLRDEMNEACGRLNGKLQWNTDADADPIELRNEVYESLRALYEEFCKISEAIENHLLYELRQRRERE